MAAPKKTSKNNPDERAKATKQPKIVLSDDCAKCQQQCEKGKKYLADIIPGKAYKGIPCRK